jgi:hypothetical protein
VSPTLAATTGLSLGVPELFAVTDVTERAELRIPVTNWLTTLGTKVLSR